MRPVLATGRLRATGTPASARLRSGTRAGPALRRASIQVAPAVAGNFPEVSRQSFAGQIAAILRRGPSLGLLRCPPALVILGILFAAPLFALDPDRSPDSYSIRGWFTEQGLPSNKVRAVCQARDGYLWLATAQGISRFDGGRFTTYNGSTHPELRGGGFYAVVEDREGTLWFGGDAGVFRLRGRSFDHFTKADGLADNRVRALAQTRAGEIVACTHTGFSLLHDGKWTTPVSWRDLPGEARAFLERADGSVILVTEEGVWRVRGESREVLAGGSDAPGRPFTCLAESSDGNLWIGTNRGVRCFRPDGTSTDITPADGTPFARVAALRIDRDGNLWIGTYGSGLFRYSHGQLEAAPYRETFGRAAIQYFLEDREGSLWIAAPVGLFRLGNTMCRSIGSTEGMSQTTVYSVIESRDGGWWIGLWGGGVYYSDGLRAQRLVIPPALGLNQVTSLAEDPAGTLWIGAATGLYRHLNQQTENVYLGQEASLWRERLAADPNLTLPGLAHAAINSVASDHAGNVWVATDGALYHGTAGQWRVETHLPGISGSVFKQVLVTRQGDVWVTLPPDGVARLHDGRWTTYLCGGPISTIYPRAILEDSDGAIWITTDGGGLNRFKHNRWRVFTSADGLADDFVAGVAEDASRQLWIATPRGLMRVPLEQFDALADGRGALDPRIFNRDDGLPAAEVNHQGAPNTTRTRDGRILIATDRGVTIVEPGRLPPSRPPPPVYLERFMVEGTPVDLHQPIVVPPGSRDIQIDYTAISLLAPEKVRFRLRLEPLDQVWTEAGNQREVRYAHIAPGDYRFHVIGSNNDGVWNETGATLAFTVRPFFYQTPWFIGLTVLTGGGAILALLRARAHLARQRLDELETLVSRRTHELRMAKEAAEATQEAADRERTRFRFIFEALPIGITWTVRDRPETRLTNPAHLRITGIANIEPVAMRDATHPDDRLKQENLHRRLLAGETDHYEIEKRYVRPDGSICWVAESCRVYTSANGEIQEILTSVDITARREAEIEREKLHHQLLDISRQAGMAEIATNVLHNVGNVLTSVNVSATLLVEEVRQSRVAVVARLAGLLREHADDLGRFLTEDPRGRTVPEFMGTLAEHLAREQATIVAEVGVLKKSVEHIKEIVAMQQNYARVSGLSEVVELVDLVEDAIRLNLTLLERHGTVVTREYSARPRLLVEKHKVLQILVNLIRNANLACAESGHTAPAITIRLSADAAKARLAVIDNGIGIPPENLTRIFAHGFTTRKDGHGFGLHSGAIAASELGGELAAHSAGPGHGATFTLTLPLQPPRRVP